MGAWEEGKGEGCEGGSVPLNPLNRVVIIAGILAWSLQYIGRICGLFPTDSNANHPFAFPLGKYMDLYVIPFFVSEFVRNEDGDTQCTVTHMWPPWTLIYHLIHSLIAIQLYCTRQWSHCQSRRLVVLLFGWIWKDAGRAKLQTAWRGTISPVERRPTVSRDDFSRDTQGDVRWGDNIRRKRGTSEPQTGNSTGLR